MPSRVSLRDIAHEVGCSHVTVSRALRNRSFVSKETLHKINRAIRKLGYQPDADLAALMTRCRQKNILGYQATLAWLSLWANGEDLKSFGYWQGAEVAAGKLGYKLERFALADSGLSLRRLGGILTARNICGIILPPQPSPANRLDLNWESFSVVALGFSVSPSLFHVVTNAQSRSASIAMRRLFGLGYRRIGFLQSREGLERTNHNFLGGYLVEQCNVASRDRIPPFVYPAGEAEKAESRFAEWIRTARPEAILHNDEYVATWIKRCGLKVPEDIGLAYLNVGDKSHPGAGAPIPAGIDQNEQTIGAKAAEFLVSMVQRGEHGTPPVPLRILVEGTWVDGPTLRKAGPRKAGASRRSPVSPKA